VIEATSRSVKVWFCFMRSNTDPLYILVTK
jgi:hypothetical protein